MEKARMYLLGRSVTMETSYDVAITAYALSYTQSPDAQQAYRKLMDLATCNESNV